MLAAGPLEFKATGGAAAQADHNFVRRSSPFSLQLCLGGASGTDTVKKLDVIGRRNAPRSYYVLSYIMARDGDRLIDIRRNCTFIFGAAAAKPDSDVQHRVLVVKNWLEATQSQLTVSAGPP